MEKYIGVKMIKGKPMNRQNYSDYRGWTLPADENGSDEGFLVEYIGSPNANHPDHIGYISWSPKDVFEDAYRKTKELPFGLAIEAARKGSSFRLPHWKEDVLIRLQVPDGNIKMTAPYLYVTSRFGMVPWIPTMIELLSDDWCIVEEVAG